MVSHYIVLPLTKLITMGLLTAITTCIDNKAIPLMIDTTHHVLAAKGLSSL